MPDNHKDIYPANIERVKLTASVSLEAYDAITELQRRHRRKRVPERLYRCGGSWTPQLQLMQDKTTFALENISNKLSFMTIDDLSVLAQKLLDGLNQLGERKHPLSIRRGVKLMVERKEQKQKGEMLKTAAKTYFFDVKETREGKPYLIITESRLKGEGEKPQRSSIIVFQENLTDFAKLVNEMAEKVNQGN